MLLPGILASGITGNLITNNFTSIATATVTSGGSSTITFSSIPSTYTHLQVRGFWQSNRTDYGVDDAFLTINGDTTGANYYVHWLYGDGSSAYGASTANDTRGIDIGLTTLGTQAGNGSTAGWGSFVMDILDYANVNKNKTFRVLGGNDFNGTGVGGLGGRVGLTSGLWAQTTAVNSLTFTAYSPRVFNQYSQFALYGVK